MYVEYFPSTHLHVSSTCDIYAFGVNVMLDQHIGYYHISTESVNHNHTHVMVVLSPCQWQNDGDMIMHTCMYILRHEG